MHGLQANHRLAEQSIPDSGDRGQGRPFAGRQARRHFLFDRGPAGDVEHLEHANDMRTLNRDRLGKTLAELIRMDGIFHLGLGQMPHHRIAAAARIVDTIDGLARRDPDPVDDPQRPQNKPLDLPGLDQGHLIDAQVATAQKYLSQGAALLACLDEQGGERVVIHQVQFQ